MGDLQQPTPADVLVGIDFTAHVQAEIANDEFDGLRGSWLRFLGARPSAAAKYASNEETASWLLVATVSGLRAERDALRKLATRIKQHAWKAADSGGVNAMHKALLVAADIAASAEEAGL